MTTSYGDIVNIPIKSMVEFKQYSLDRHENKKLEDTVVGELFTIIPSCEQLSLELLETYYKGVSSEHYTALSYSPDIRLVIIIGNDRMGIPIYKTISINSYFYSVGLQTIEYKELTTFKPELPNQILGFSSYDIGSKFKA